MTSMRAPATGLGAELGLIGVQRGDGHAGAGVGACRAESAVVAQWVGAGDEFIGCT